MSSKKSRNNKDTTISGISINHAWKLHLHYKYGPQPIYSYTSQLKFLMQISKWVVSDSCLQKHNIIWTTEEQATQAWGNSIHTNIMRLLMWATGICRRCNCFICNHTFCPWTKTHNKKNYITAPTPSSQFYEQQQCIIQRLEVENWFLLEVI